MPSEPGKCYAKCLIQTTYDKKTVYLPEYIGSDSMILANFVEENTIKINDGQTEWVKKKRDEDCESSDPDDCLVWCIVERPAKYMTIDYLTDTTVSKDFYMNIIELSRIDQIGGFTEWKEVVCEADITSGLYKKVQKALTAAGFKTKTNGRISEETKNALVDYQKHYGLPVGNLDMETKEHLDLDRFSEKDHEKCFANCLISNGTLIDTIAIPVYYGNESFVSDKYVTDTLINISEEEFMSIDVYLKDTSVTDEYSLHLVEVSSVDMANASEEWLEVVCARDITAEFYRNIQEVLLDKGFDIGVSKPNGQFTSATKKALVTYQKRYRLPIGNLNVLTLEHLGVW